MTDKEIQKYNSNLDLYSSIMRNKTKDIPVIEECLRVFEYFEDYEKCEHLIRILKEETDLKNHDLNCGEEPR